MEIKKNKDNMKQFTVEEAIEFAESGIWKTWDDEQIVRLQLFQEKLCMDFSRFHQALEKVLGRPIQTIEFAFGNRIMEEYLGIREAPTLEEIINLIPADKRLIIKL